MSKDIFIDKKNNDIFSKYKNIKIKKMYLTISYIDKNLLKILEYICEERNIKKLIKHHTSLILVMEKEGQNIIYLKSVKLSKRKILFSHFLENYIKKKGIYSLHSYYSLDDNCFTFVNDILRFNNLCIPKNNLLENLYKSYLNIKLDKNKRRFGLSIKTMMRIINFVFRYKIMRIILMFIAQFVS